MYPRHPVVASAALASLALLRGAWGEPSDPILGCKDLSCPTNDEGSLFECTVGNETYSNLGFERIPDVPEALSGVSLLKGANIVDEADADYDIPKGTRPYRSSYYLSLPAKLSFDSIAGCAAVFLNTTSRLSFGENTQHSVGTCPDVLSKSCINRLQGLAKDAVSGAKDDRCEALDRAIRKTTLNECRDGDLGRTSVVSLESLSPIKGSKNSSSNCWPTEPKDQQLAQFANDDALRDFYISTITQEFHRITPVLTVFFNGPNDTIKLSSPSAQLTCLKALYVDSLMNADSGDEDNGARLTKRLSPMIAGLALGTVAVSLFL